MNAAVLRALLRTGEAMMSPLLERLEHKEAAARQRLEELLEQVEAAQQDVERFRITRETMAALAAEDDEDGVVDSGDDTSDDHDGAERPRLRGLREQAVVLLASAEEPMRARDVVRAMGKPDTRSQVEGMRSRLKRLVEDGWLAERAQGLYTIASGVNGSAGKGAAPRR
ncbi:hypothetical protein ACIBP6_03210 [Nonomuraea terrae]|uniref:hypothetical protein n=1 Tax=Nonomuraea terrae TaxID=2530383 RepID=UPI0037A4F9BF